MSPESAQHGASITMRGLTKRYASVTAVDAIDLDARPGEFLTLLGPSGSGKTTTLNMIAGFVDVTEGDLLIDEKPVANLPPYRRNIGMVFQHYALFPHMSVNDNVEYPLRQRKIAKAQRQTMVGNALETVGLGHLGRRRPKELSGGQQQRVALARAMVYNPRVLLMDEPLGALDKKLRDSLQLEIKRIHADLGTTFVYVTHDQDEALVLSDRIAVFNEGRIKQVDTPSELYERPNSVFVAQFLGESTLFRGILDGDGSIDFNGHRLTATRGERSSGASGAVVVRPERIHLHPDGPQPHGANVVPGRVVQHIYFGNSRKVEVRLDDGSTALVRESAGAALTSVHTDDRIWLTFESDDAAFLPIDDDPVPAVPEPSTLDTDN